MEPAPSLRETGNPSLNSLDKGLELETEIPSPLQNLFEGRFRAAVEMARAAGQSTLEHFRSPISVERKGDDSPVTIADKNAEKLVRTQLEIQFPQDAILGEEFGYQSGESEYQWIVDPIDGTKSFIFGVPLYSTLLSLSHRGHTIAGIIYIPALDEMVMAAKGHGAWHAIAGTPLRRCFVSQRCMSEGAFLTSQVDSFAKVGAQQAFERIQAEAYVTRTWGDGYGYLLVATGRAELMVDPIANPWDLAAVQVVVEEAGGRFSDWLGEPTAFGGNGIGSNGLVHDFALGILRPNGAKR
jgi:histidinol-phosphatase